ncbi:hypothetical protein [Desulfobulbus alkaliphilus]|uniref:hypothetical protein n=1 Tax=Desulfobulbus alkaliphilus TaxID=869814 RepID=UPI0019662EF6|nr:hypothetical protein [Desulfobulbus alkaliphilus]MBM9538067.1 hypothetical protein [Desulfobulbus alkaliphilus]
MNTLTQNPGTGIQPKPRRLRRGWFGLLAGLALLWAMAFVILPYAQTLPYIQPVMGAIADSDVDAGTYWYTQSEKTAVGQMYVRNTLRNR